MARLSSFLISLPFAIQLALAVEPIAPVEGLGLPVSNSSLPTAVSALDQVAATSLLKNEEPNSTLTAVTTPAPTVKRGLTDLSGVDGLVDVINQSLQFALPTSDATSQAAAPTSADGTSQATAPASSDVASQAAQTTPAPTVKRGLGLSDAEALMDIVNQSLEAALSSTAASTLAASNNVTAQASLATTAATSAASSSASNAEQTTNASPSFSAFPSSIDLADRIQNAANAVSTASSNSTTKAKRDLPVLANEALPLPSPATPSITSLISLPTTFVTATKPVTV